MPWGWECRAKLVKQIPAKPTQRRGEVDTKCPGPLHYEVPEIIGGKGFSHIKRAPAYTFGHLTPADPRKPATAQANLFNVQGFGNKGRYKITHSVVGTLNDGITTKMKVPGPGAYHPLDQIRYKRPPAYSVRPAPRPPYEPWDQWTPPPNMYWPPLLGKKPPAYTMSHKPKHDKDQNIPGPGEHEPNFKYVKKNLPKQSFGAPYKPLKSFATPAPNTYCEKKFMVTKRAIPAPSFGIRHSQYIGQQETYLKPSKLDLMAAP